MHEESSRNWNVAESLPETNYSAGLTSLPGCKVESALNSPSGWLLHYVGTSCFNRCIQDEQDDGVKP